MASKKIKQVKESKMNKKQNKRNPRKPNVVKTTLDNPFSFRCPVTEEDVEKEIKMQLQMCCSDLALPTFKPPLKCVMKLKGEDRRLFLKKYKEDALEKLLKHPESAGKYKAAKEERSHLIFGYNAVMRALEQNKIAGILLKKDIAPVFLGETFVPGCLSRNVALVSVSGLDEILRREDTLHVKHSVMVLGLKPSVKDTSSRFFPLYCCMQKVLETLIKANLRCNEENEEWADIDRMRESEINGPESRSNAQISDVEDNAKSGDDSFTRKEFVPKYKLTAKEIDSYHLKRLGSTSRVFIPEVKVTKKVVIEEDVISLDILDQTQKETRTTGFQFNFSLDSNIESSDDANAHGQKKGSDGITDKTQPNNIDFSFFIDTEGSPEKVEEVRDSEDDEFNFPCEDIGLLPEGTKVGHLTTTSFSSVKDVGESIEKKDDKLDFFIDTDGDCDMSAVEGNNDNLNETVPGKKIKSKATGVKKRKERPTLSYRPAKIKRVKSNPNRISKKKKE